MCEPIVSVTPDHLHKSRPKRNHQAIFMAILGPADAHATLLSPITCLCIHLQRCSCKGIPTGPCLVRPLCRNVKLIIIIIMA